MDFAHPRGQVRHFQSFFVEDVGVAAAARGLSPHLYAEVPACGADQTHESGVVCDIHPVVIPLDLRLNAGAERLPVELQPVARGRLFEAADHVGRLLRQLFLAVASGLALEKHGIGNDIDRYAALYQADVRRCLLIDPSQPHARDPLGRYLNRADSFLGTDSSMRLQAANVKLKTIGGRRLGKKKPYGVAVQHQPGARPQTRYVKTLGPQETGLFADGEYHIQSGAGKIFFLDHAQHFTDDGDAALVVPAEHGATIALQDAAVQDWRHTFSWGYRVHVGGKQKRPRARRITAPMSDEIADVPANLLSGIVDPDLCA